MKRFNTSHVTLYQKYPTYETTGGYRFNTSHVTLYHENIDIIPANGYRFNTSHVTLYRTENSMEWNGENSFNTSHVTLYPALLICANCGHSFQYISCYSLSRLLEKKHGFKRGFQYISCYSLSTEVNAYPGDQNVSIHLMLLFIRKEHYQ